MIDESINKFSDEELELYFMKANLKELHELKLKLDDMYYNTNEASFLDDWQYDILKETLQKRDPDYVVPIGAKIRMGDNRVELPYPLFSMDKMKPEDVKEIARWLIKNKSDEYVFEDKLDGVSALLRYDENGKISMYTRGDGEVGADISYMVQYFSSVPKSVDGRNLNVRGELIMRNSVFEDKYSENYANPRNLVAGRVGAKTVREGIADIEFIAYEIIGDGVMPSPTEQLKFLDDLGFTTVRREVVSNITIEGLMETFVKFKGDTDFDIDGVIVQGDKAYERNLTGNPDYAFAFKMRLDGNLIEMEVIEVEWRVSKWGLLKPRLRLKPKKLGGVTITYATAFNAKYVNDNKIGPDTKVMLTRSGDVIPYVAKIITQSEKPQMPDIPYTWNESGVDIFTETMEEEICIKLISSFFSKLGVKHVGEQNVRKMYDSGLDTLLKILYATKSRFETVEGFGDRLAERTYDNIHGGMKGLSVPVVLGASGIFGFGLGRKRIETLFDEIPNILDLSKDTDRPVLMDKIMSVDGFSEKSSVRIVDNIGWADKFINAMRKVATFEEKVIVSDGMKGMKVVFTGFRDKMLEKEVSSRGGKITSSVSKSTSLLVVKTKGGSKSGKVKDAEKHGVEVLDKAEFMKKYIN